MKYNQGEVSRGGRARRRRLTDGHVEQAAWADDGEQAVDVIKDVGEDLGLCSWGGPVLRVEARVDDAIHVKVQVVKLDAIWVGCGGVHRDLNPANPLRVVLNHITHNLWIPAARVAQSDT